MWQDYKTWNVTKLKNSNCGITQNTQYDKKKIKNKKKMWQNWKKSKCDKNQKLKMWQKSKTKNVIQLKNIKMWQNSKLKIWLNWTTQI